MKIEIKKIGLLRLAGACLILIGLFSSIFLDLFILDAWTVSLIALLIEIPWILLSIFIKLEINYFKENLKLISIVLYVSFIIFIVFGLLLSPNLSIAILFILILISTFCLTACWHFSISIFKKEKIIAVLGGVGYGILSIFCRFNELGILFGPVTSLTPIFLISIGFILILVIEYYMMRKGLLKYV
ncbi:MAG: hypothetical protein ACFFD5_05820 [Candidatus Thorarchaeota archaeon]